MPQLVVEVPWTTCRSLPYSSPRRVSTGRTGDRRRSYRGVAETREQREEGWRLRRAALSRTDHGVMYGAVKFYKEAKDAGIKPLMGCEVYVTADRNDRSRAPYYHLTLIARTAEGYRNLMKLSTCGFLEGFYYKPRVDMEMLRKYGRGIICLSGCLSAEVPTRILEGRPEEARR